MVLPAPNVPLTQMITHESFPGTMIEKQVEHRPKDAQLQRCSRDARTQRGDAIGEGADVSDNYRKDPEAISALTPEQYRVTQKKGTEPPFRNEYWDNKEPGIYVDVVSGEPLFASTSKYDSRTGWPSFTVPIEPENIVKRRDFRALGARH